MSGGGGTKGKGKQRLWGAAKRMVKQRGEPKKNRGWGRGESNRKRAGCKKPHTHTHRRGVSLREAPRRHHQVPKTGVKTHHRGCVNEGRTMDQKKDP